MSEKDPIQNHGDAEEWTSYAPNCPPPFPPEADKGCTDAGAPALRGKQFDAENRKYSPKYSPVLSEHFGFALNVPQRETSKLVPVNWVRVKNKQNKTGNYLD